METECPSVGISFPEIRLHTHSNESADSKLDRLRFWYPSGALGSPAVRSEKGQAAYELSESSDQPLEGLHGDPLLGRTTEVGRARDPRLPYLPSDV